MNGIGRRPLARLPDATDGAILGHLQRYGRITNKELAERVGLSQSACSERVKRLQRAALLPATSRFWIGVSSARTSA